MGNNEIQESKAEKNARANEMRDLQEILNLPSGAGKRFVRRQFEEWGLLVNPFTGNSQTYLNCGLQSAAQWLFGEVVEANSVIAAELLIKTKQSENKE